MIFKANPEPVYDCTNFKKIRAEVSSVSPGEKRLRMHLLFGIRVGFKCISRAKMKAEDAKAGGCLRVCTPGITKVLTYC